MQGGRTEDSILLGAMNTSRFAGTEWKARGVCERMMNSQKHHTSMSASFRDPLSEFSNSVSLMFLPAWTQIVKKLNETLAREVINL